MNTADASRAPTMPSEVRGRGRRRSISGLAASMAAVMLVMGLLVVASSSGAVRVWSEPPPGTPQRFDPVAVDESGTAAEAGEGTAPPREDSDGWFMRIVALITGVVLLRVAWMVVMGWWAILRSWRLERERTTTTSFDVLPNVIGPLSVSLDEAAQVQALRTGEPRNAIVACWTRLEDDVAAAGLPPLASETSAELTARVLDAALADRAAVLDLADRYREARFSEHPIGERERELALETLGRIHASLRLPRAAG